MLTNKNLSILLVFCVALFAQILLYHHYLVSYFPISDDIAVFANSWKWDPVHWITSGFSEYFIVYPEWTESYTNFMRPGANILFWLFQNVFGENYYLYLLSVYAIHAGGVALAFYTVSRILQLGMRFSLLAAFLMFINPAAGFYNLPSFAVDAFAGCLACLTVIAVFKKRIIVALVLATVTIFTKETTLFLPLAIALGLFLQDYIFKDGVTTGKLKFPLLFAIIPYGLWVVCRLAFYQGIRGVYMIDRPEALSLLVLKGLLIWPLGIIGPSFTIETLFKNAVAFQNSPKEWLVLFGITINIALWIILLKKAVYALAGIAGQKFSAFKKKNNANVCGFILLTLYSLGATILLAVMMLGQRFGYSLFIVFISLIMYFFKNALHRRELAGVVVLSCVVFAWSVNGMFRILEIRDRQAAENYNEVTRLSKQLYSLLKTLKAKSHIYIANDVVAGHSGAWLGKFAGLNSEITIVNQIRSDVNVKALTTAIVINQEADEIMFSVKLLKPDSFFFPGVKKELFTDGRNRIVRNLSMVYECNSGNGTDSMSIRIAGITSKDAFVYYDPKKGSYVLL